MTMTLQTTVKLNNGVDIPLLGLGVYMSTPGQECKTAVKLALQQGYRHIDTAKLYENEKDVGEAVKESGVAREEVFITTKLWNSDHGYESTIKACETSLEELGTYIDLYLIHWPVEDLRKDSWRALEKLLEQGKCRAIGVSNYTVRHLEELMQYCNVMPTVNQVEFSPFLYQKELHEFCKSHNIYLEAYSPLTRGKKLSDSRLVAIANKYHKTPAQILIHWCLQHDIVVLPKSVKQERIAENANIYDFAISDADMQALNELNENFRTCWNPSDVK